MVTKFLKYKMIFVVLILLCGCAKTANKDSASKKMHSFDLIIQQVDDSMAVNPNYALRLINNNIHNVKDSVVYCKFISMRAWSYVRKSQNDSANKYIGIILNYARNKPENKDVNDLYRRAYSIIGNSFTLKSSYDSAIHYYSQAYRKGVKFINKKNCVGVVKVLMNLADTYVHIGNYAEASSHYRRAIFLCDSLSVKDKIVIPIYYGLGQVYMELRDYELSDYYFQYASRFIDRMGAYDKFCFYTAVCNSYYFRKKYVEAEKYGLLSLKIAQKSPEMIYDQNVAKANYGELLLINKRCDLGEKYLNEAYSFFKKSRNESGMFMEETQLMKLALKRKNMSLARRYFRLSSTRSLKHIDSNLILIHNDILQEYYASAGNYRKAFEYQNKSIQLNDSIRSIQVKARVAELDLRYKQNARMMKNEMQLKDQQNKIKRLKLFSIITVLILIILILGTYVIIWLKSRRRSLMLQQKSNELKSARLKNIRNCLSPHFVFNILNHEINQENLEKVKDDLFDLTKLMRRTIEIADKLDVTLEDELCFVNSYLNLVSNSFDKNDFVCTIDIDKLVNTQEIRIPSMIIYQSVENAIKHGLIGIEGHKELVILAGRKQSGVEIKIIDNGRGYHPEVFITANGTRTGQKAMRRTVDFLNTNNKEKIAYTIENREDASSTGTTVTVFIPNKYSFEMHGYGQKI